MRKTMELKDLKTGWIVKYRDGRLRTVFLGTADGDVFAGEFGVCATFNFFDHNLINNNDHSMDIIAVYKENPKNGVIDYTFISSREPLWIRQEKLTRKDVDELYNLCLDINELESRNQDMTGSKPTIFFSISGHCNCLEVRIFPNGWKTNTSPEKTYSLYLDHDDSTEVYKECVEYLRDIKNAMP